MTSTVSRLSRSRLGLCLQGAVACSISALVFSACSSTATPPLVVSQDGGTSSGGIEQDGGTITPSDAGTKQDGAVSSDAAPDGPTVAPLCGGTFQLATSTVVANVKAPFSLTDDELVVAWADGAVPNVVVHIAERANRADPFVEKDTLDSTNGVFALDRPVLEARGFDVGILASSRQAWYLYSRQSRGTAFTASAKGIFQELIAFTNKLGPNELLHDPVWTSAGRSMIFGVATKGIYVSDAILGADDFDVPREFSARAELKPVGANRRRPSGLSGEGFTFLYLDETTNQTMAASRSTGDFTSFTSLGAISDAKVGLGCKTLYYSDGNSVRVAAQP